MNANDETMLKTEILVKGPTKECFSLILVFGTMLLISYKKINLALDKRHSSVQIKPADSVLVKDFATS